MTPDNYSGMNAFYQVRLHQKPFSKYAVALRAAALLNEGDSFVIDAGSSLTPLAKIVRKMADVKKNFTHYTIMTHNQGAFESLLDTPPESRFNVFQTGGRYDRDLNASFGHQAETAYLQFNPKWVFIGQNGLEAHQGLFCHGNTEELTLKKEIFSMPALGRVVISDFSKIGSFGGLLFGDSSNLTTNVERCMIITDDIHDKKFSSGQRPNKDRIISHDQKEEERAKERFNTQCRILEETYGIHIEKVHYCVYEFLSEADLRHNKASALIDTPLERYRALSDQFRNEKNLNELYFRIYLTEEDKPHRIKNFVPSPDQETVDFSDSFCASVDIKFEKTASGGTPSLSETRVLDVNLRWDEHGDPFLQKSSINNAFKNGEQTDHCD